MKKYLMTGIAAIAMCAAFTSCSHDPGFEQTTQEDLDKAKYEAAFISRFGQPAADQDWGFGQFRAGAVTRAADPGDGGAWFGPEQGSTYAAMGLVAPEMVSADEEREVAKWFREHQYPTSDPIDLSTFFVQQVHFNHKEYSSTNSGHKNVGGDHMDWICAGSDAMGDDHINNFNANSPGRYYIEGGWTNARDYQANMMLMVNSSTQRFGYKESANTENKVYHTFVLKALTINGKLGYYVGFDYEAHGQNGNFNADGYYDDRIIKIVPGNGYTTPPTPPVTTADVRVIAEDLTVSEKGDFDFNDVVFDVYYNYNNTGKTAIMLQAAGGTYPLYVAGYEVHAQFGEAPNVMINTGVGTQHEPVLIQLTETYTDANDILVQVDKGKGRETLTAEVGRAPHKIAVIPTFQIIPERQDIETYYKKFPQWVQDPQLRWY